MTDTNGNDKWQESIVRRNALIEQLKRLGIRPKNAQSMKIKDLQQLLLDAKRKR